jgi:hypothetical protein
MGQNPDWGLQENLAFLIHSEISEVLRSASFLNFLFFKNHTMFSTALTKKRRLTIPDFTGTIPAGKAHRSIDAIDITEKIFINKRLRT